MMRWLEEDGHVSVFRSPSNFSNGNTRDREGRLVTCEQQTRRVTRTEHDGTITVLADRYDGKPFNSPNDVVVAKDGAVWFSDPTYGISGNYEGDKQDSEQPTRVYRIDAASGAVSIAADGMVQPNGLAFSPDEKLLYIVIPARRRCASTRSARATSWARAASSRAASRRASPTACDSTPKGMCGARWAGPTRRRTACAATTPTAR